MERNAMANPIKEDAVYSDREVAEFLFKDALKPTSWKTIQRMARNGDIQGNQIGRGGWRFLGSAVLDYLDRKSVV